MDVPLPSAFIMMRKEASWGNMLATWNTRSSRARVKAPAAGATVNTN